MRDAASAGGGAGARAVRLESSKGAFSGRLAGQERSWGSGLSENVVWHVVNHRCTQAGLDRVAPHDLRRTCAKLCHSAGGELEQIQFLLGHSSVQTTERYLGCKQNLGSPVNDRFAPLAMRLAGG
jgi:integrase